MTICIAAGCRDEGHYRIVLCTDWQISTTVGSADIMLKQRYLPHDCILMTAGSDSEILACKSLINRRYMAEQSLDETNFTKCLREAIAARKREKIEEYINAHLAVSYDDFMKFGKERFPDNILSDAYLTIATMKIDADFIVAGFQMGTFPMLAESDEAGVVKLREDDVAIGSGRHLAMAALLSRVQSDSEDLDTTLYRVFEAKKYAEKISTVGKTTTISVMYPDGHVDRIDGNGKKLLEQKYKEFGPQAIDPKFKIDRAFFDPSKKAPPK